eukprot:353796-Chlamydomonas_euryale.AAC.2
MTVLHDRSNFITSCQTGRVHIVFVYDGRDETGCWYVGIPPGTARHAVASKPPGFVVQRLTKTLIPGALIHSAQFRAA